ncbi:TerD family protein [Nocardiopsis oceani]
MSYREIIQRTLRVPEPIGAPGDGSAATRQLDAALLTAGFALSGELRSRIEVLSDEDVHRVARQVMDAVRELAGAHARHNVYFRNFPEKVPNTVEFWLTCLVSALGDPEARDGVELRDGALNLLSLPEYGRYQHTYAELAAARDDFVASAKDRLTLLHLGKPLAQEAHWLFLDLAASPIPLSEFERELLAWLAGEAATVLGEGALPEMPVRENRALVNAALIRAGRDPVVDTATDVLRLAQVLSDGDVSLTAPRRLRSFARRERRILMAALDRVIAENEDKLADVGRHLQGWKRLGEGLHPHEYRRFAHAREVFAVARGERRVRTFNAKVESAFLDGDLDRAVRLLSTAPGMLVRTLDRLLRAGGPETAPNLAERVRTLGPRVSSRVLLAAREELANRTVSGRVRLFANQTARGWTARDTREPLGREVVRTLLDAIDEVVAARMPAQDLLLVDPAVRTVAVPRSAKGVPKGFGVLPRGTVTPVGGDLLRFFVHWLDGERTTDLDLSVLLLDDDYAPVGHVSWTNLKEIGAVHSGDLVMAPGPDGATEMIELDLNRMAARHVVPQVHVYSGDRFTFLPEAFFGYMVRDGEQEGMPFDPRTVRVRSDLEGEAPVAVPLVFSQTQEGWEARWLHLFLRGAGLANKVETTGIPAREQARSVVERRYLTIGDLVDLMERTSGEVRDYDGRPPTAEEVAARTVRYVGLERPEGLPEGVDAITQVDLPVLLADPAEANGPGRDRRGP